MDMPLWTPELVRPLLEQINSHPSCTGSRRAVFERLLTEPKMQVVYEQFLRRNRQTGEYLYPARERTENQSRDEAQLVAIEQVLQLVVSAASDRISVSKLEQIEQAKRRWGDSATKLRALAHDMNLFIELGMLKLADDPLSQALSIHDQQTLLRVANWIDHLSASTRRPDDPLVVERHRGDPIVRGVQILIGLKLEEQFGERLDGTAATLTAVALGADTTPRASRSALTDQKPLKKRSAQ